MNNRKAMFFNSFSGIPDPIMWARFNNSLVDEAGNYTITANGTNTYSNGVWSGVANESINIATPPDKLIIDNSLGSLDFGNGLNDFPFSACFSFNASNIGVLEGSFYNKFLYCNRDDSQTDSNLKKSMQINLNNNLSPNLNVIFFDESTGGIIISTTNMTFSNNVDYFVVVTNDGSGTYEGIRTYVNGELQDTTDNSSGVYVAMESFNNDIVLAGQQFSVTDPFTIFCDLDNYGIFDKRLTHKQVFELSTLVMNGNELL